MKSTPAIPVAALRNPHFQTPLPVLRVKIDPSWQYQQCFQKVLAALRENRPALPDGGDWARKLTPALIPAPRSQERGRSLLCKRLVLFPLKVGSGNRPILRQADSQTLCLPQTEVWELRPERWLFSAVGYTLQTFRKGSHGGNTALTGANSYATERGSSSFSAASGSR